MLECSSKVGLAVQPSVPKYVSVTWKRNTDHTLCGVQDREVMLCLVHSVESTLLLEPPWNALYVPSATKAVTDTVEGCGSLNSIIFGPVPVSTH